MRKTRLPRGRYRYASILFIMRALSVFVTMVALGFTLHLKDEKVGYLFAGSLGLTVVLSILYSLARSGLVCPTCRTGVFGSARCSRHRDAKRWLGSYTAPLAANVLINRKRLDCQYCGGNFRFRDYTSEELENRQKMDGSRRFVKTRMMP